MEKEKKESRYLDFDNEKYQKGYELLELNSTNARSYIGKKICYLLSSDMDNHRGSFFVNYATIHSVRRNRIFIRDGSDEFSLRNLLEAGIKIEQ